MDTIEQYRAILRNIIEQYARYKPSHGQIDTETVIDAERDHYEVLHVGWDGVRRVHGSVIHVDIIDGKIWIQYDGTSQPVAQELLTAGVPRDAIVLGFYPAEERQYTDFSTG